jgi:hypothetical protein
MDLSQFSGMLVFLVVLTMGFWLMIFLMTFVVPYWLFGNILEIIKERKNKKSRLKDTSS